MTAWLAQHWLAAALFLAYTAMLVVHARAGLVAGKTAPGFFVGGRRLGGAAIGVSFYATFASTNSYIGHAGKGYEYGLPWLTMAVMLVLFAWLSWRLVAPRMRRFAAAWGSLTVPDFLATRFASDRVRVAAGLVIAFSSLLYLVAVFKGAAICCRCSSASRIRWRWARRWRSSSATRPWAASSPWCARTWRKGC